MKGYFEIGDSVVITKPGFVIGSRGRQIKIDGARAIITGFGLTVVSRYDTADSAVQGIYKDRQKVYLRLFQDGDVVHQFGANDLRLVDGAEQLRRETESPETAPLVRLSALPNTPFWEGDVVTHAGLARLALGLFAPWKLSETFQVERIHYEMSSTGEWIALYILARRDPSHQGQPTFNRAFGLDLKLVARGPIWYRDHPHGA